MEYTVTVTRPGQPTDDAPTRYNDETAALLLRRALRQGLHLSADAATGRITICDDGRRITVTPVEPLPKPTAAQWREIVALSASTGPLTWDYGRQNVVQLRDWGRERLLVHRTTLSLMNGGFLGPNTGKGNPARLSLLAYLVLGKGYGDDSTLTHHLRNVYGQPVNA